MKLYIFLIAFAILSFKTLAQNDTIRNNWDSKTHLGVPSPFGFGAGVTGGAVVTTASFSQNFEPVGGDVEFTGNFYYNRAFMDIGLHLLAFKSNRDIILTGQSIEKGKASLELTGFPFYGLLGYDIAKSNDWRIAPFLGYTTLYYNVESDLKTQNKTLEEFTSHPFAVGSTGVLVERLFGSFKDKKTPRYVRHGLATTSLRAKITYFHPFDMPNSGNLIGLTAGFILYMNSGINVKND
jgi:hypothetical protein